MRAPTRFSTRSLLRLRSEFAWENWASERAVCCSRMERRVKFAWPRALGAWVALSSLMRLWRRWTW